VIQTSVAEGALMLRVADRSVGEYWRAVLGLKGRLVTISVTAPDPETGRRLLEAGDGGHAAREPRRRGMKY
jgi:hypothetical protein